MLTITRLSKTFYQNTTPRLVVRNVSLTVKNGHVFGFLGLNGAGKTTTLKLITGLLFADSGKITIGGKPASESETRNLFGYMSESPQFYRHLTVSEVLLYVGELFELDRTVIAKRTMQLLQDVQLIGAQDLAVGKLSKGMTQRLALAVALINDPPLLLLDEPLDGLDPVGRLEFKQLIQQQKKQGKTVFFSSHILSDVAEICDEVAIIHHGQIIAQGSPKTLLGKSSQTLEEFFVKTVKAAK